MTGGELEAVIWRHWPARGPGGAAAVDAIMAAAREFAASEAVVLAAAELDRSPAVTAARRRVLADGDPANPARKRRPA